MQLKNDFHCGYSSITEGKPTTMMCYNMYSNTPKRGLTLELVDDTGTTSPITIKFNEFDILWESARSSFPYHSYFYIEVGILKKFLLAAINNFYGTSIEVSDIFDFGYKVYNESPTLTIADTDKKLQITPETIVTVNNNLLRHYKRVSSKKCQVDDCNTKFSLNYNVTLI